MHSKQYTMNDFLMISFFQVFDRKGALSHIRGVLKWGKMNLQFSKHRTNSGLKIKRQLSKQLTCSYFFNFVWHDHKNIFASVGI